VTDVSVPVQNKMYFSKFNTADTVQVRTFDYSSKAFRPSIPILKIFFQARIHVSQQMP
jgi:hypothetical protein